MAEQLYNEYVEDGDPDELPEGRKLEYKRKLKEAAKALEIDEKEDIETINIDSAKHPDHSYKIGYFRSSYNGGGTNTILKNAIGKDLYYIFQPADNYIFVPDWPNCLTRAQEVLKELKEFSEKCSFSIDPVFHCPNRGPASTEEAAKVLKNELETNKKDKMLFGSYSNANGHFFIKEPAEVIAIMTGSLKMILGNETVPCTYVAYKNDLKWYIEAIEVVIEAIEYALNNKNGICALAWSS